MLEARSIVEQEGLERLSLREVARRLGVSHGAPYRHFPSRDHILAEVVASAFADFAAQLDGRTKTGTAHEDMASMGKTYLAYSASHPLNYRLMFGTSLPDPKQHPEMMRQAHHAFALLRRCIADTYAADGRPAPAEQIDLDAMFVWSTMHGVAGALSGDAIKQIGVLEELVARLPEHALFRIECALDVGHGSTPPAEERGNGNISA